MVRNLTGTVLVSARLSNGLHRGRWKNQFERKIRIARVSGRLYAFLAMTKEGLLPMPNHQQQAVTANAGDDLRWSAVVERDARRDGQFVFAVSTTGVYC